MTTGRINQVNIFKQSKDTEIENKQSQTNKHAAHRSQHSHQELLDANTHRTQHAIMLSVADSHSSLSQKKDKNTDRSLAHSHIRPHHSTRQNARRSSTASRRITHTKLTNRKQKTEAANAQVQYYQRRREYGFPHTTTTAPINSILFYKTESVFPKH